LRKIMAETLLSLLIPEVIMRTSRDVISRIPEELDSCKLIVSQKVFGVKINAIFEDRIGEERRIRRRVWLIEGHE
jgi:hypothetical protein